MARCGRCGLWSTYPEDHPETKYAGVCVWYQLRLPRHEVFEHRECHEFFERIPGVAPMGHFQYKLQQDNLRDSYILAKRSKVLSYVAVVISVGSLLFNIIKSL